MPGTRPGMTWWVKAIVTCCGIVVPGLEPAATDRPTSPLIELRRTHHRRCTRPFPREQGIPRMPARLVPVTEAFARFLPALTRDDIAARMMGRILRDQLALVIDGDLNLDKKGLVGTEELEPEVTRALPNREPPAAIFVAGSIIGPDTVLAEYDYDWSP